MTARGIARAVLVAASAVALASPSARGQIVTFSTTGSFSGGGCTTSSCAFDGFTLSFTPVGSNSFFSGSLVDLGSFATQCVSCTNGVLQNFPSGVIFTLTINQTVPSSGNGSFSGTVSGTLAYNPTFSSLIWTPSPNSLGIGAANYVLVIDNTGNFNIEAPTPDANPNPTVVKAFVTTTPEASTIALTATALLVLVPLIRRRRA